MISTEFDSLRDQFYIEQPTPTDYARAALSHVAYIFSQLAHH
jgi:hypothetical protein